MPGHQYTADMVNDELNQFQEMQEGSLDSIGRIQILRYLGSRVRLRTQNSSVGVIFDARQNDQNIFQNFEIFFFVEFYGGSYDI